MKNLIILCLLAFAIVGQAVVQTDSLQHRWLFTETGGNFYTDTVGGVNLVRQSGKVVSAAGQTNGAVPGIMIGDADGNNGAAFLQAHHAFFDNGKNWTFEVIFRCAGGASSGSRQGNIVGISNDYTAAGPTGINIGRYMTHNPDRWRTLVKGASGGTSTVETNADAARYTGQLHHIVVTSNGTADSTLVLYAPLSESALRNSLLLGPAKAAPTDTLLNVGDEDYFVGQIHLMEIRFYNDGLTRDSLNANHAADIARYCTAGLMDVWVDGRSSTNGYGTIGSPFNALTTAWQRISDGSTIYLYPGTYEGSNSPGTTSGPSAVNQITIESTDQDTLRTTIEAGATDTDYPFHADDGSWTLRWLRIDADSTTGFAVYADSMGIDSLNVKQCAIFNTKGGASSGTGILSRANLTHVDSCLFYKIREHGVYLAGLDASADTDGHRISRNTIRDFSRYGIQISNEDDTTYTHNNVQVFANVIESPNDNASLAGGMNLQGCDTLLCYNNLIDFTGTSLSVTNGIKTSSGSTSGTEDGLFCNNEITGVYYALSEGTAEGTGVSLDNQFYNNWLHDNTQDFNAGNSTTYQIRYNISNGATTGVPTDSTGNQTGKALTEFLRRYGGTPVSVFNGTTAGFYPVGVTLVEGTREPIISRNETGITTAVEALARMRELQKTGVELDWVIDRANPEIDRMNLEIWLTQSHPIAATDSIARVWSWADMAEDTLRIGEVR